MNPWVKNYKTKNYEGKNSKGVSMLGRNLCLGKAYGGAVACGWAKVMAGEKLTDARKLLVKQNLWLS